MAPWVLLLATVIAGSPPENPVLTQLTGQGIRVEEEVFVKLKSPTMPDGLDAAAQQEVIKKAAGPKPLSLLMRDSVVAPFVLKIDRAATREGAPPMRSIDVWFVAYGRLEQFTSEESLEELADTAVPKGKSGLPVAKGVLTEEEMQKRGLCVDDGEDRRERFFYSTFALFDRVQLSATRRVVLTSGSESVLVAAIIDPRFATDPDYPNQWRPVSRNELAEFELGPVNAYQSAGFYAKVTRLTEPSGALFIEYHQLFAEPEQWVDVPRLLRPKLPMMVQDGVRKLRRRLRE